MKKKILVVDDEVGIRLLLEDLLGTGNNEVLTAQNGKEALDLLATHTIDLLIIDYKLPIIDGIAVVQQLDKENQPIPTIIMSGLVENILEETSVLPNVKEVLSKPFDILELNTLVKNLLK
ncbi:response regulator [Ornithinibacillus contaminans]|uniref:response regulator n=1 Tax=Ornithinibacillus contaminans TaxID=694055 RepID=UPI00064DA769|nr:response regulator [Ornithinibacillus contaminans]